MPSAALPAETTVTPRRRKRSTTAEMVIDVPPSEPPSPQERLREALPLTVDCLKRRRADLIDSQLIEDFVDLQWLEWHGGGLRLTVTGSNVCAQIAARGR